MPMSTVFEGSTSYLQILDKDGNIDELFNPRLPKEFLLRMYIGMVLGRAFDDKCIKLQRQGRMLTYAPLRGQEAAQIGSAAALKDEDWLFPSYREHASYLYRGVSMKSLMIYWMGSELGMKLPEGKNNFSISIPIATQLLHAVGTAWAAMIQKHKIVTLVYFGDGATSEGDFHEAMNFAGVFKTPTVFFCQNNQWAISVPRKRQTASKTIAQKALAYGFNGIQVDGNDVLAVYKATAEAVEQARSGGGPTLIEAVTYRMGAHTTADDPTKYRNPEELKYWEERDPIKRFQNYLKMQDYWSGDLEKKILDNISAQVEKAVVDAEAEKTDNPEDMFAFTYSVMPPYLKEQKDELMAYIKEKK